MRSKLCASRGIGGSKVPKSTSRSKLESGDFICQSRPNGLHSLIEVLNPQQKDDIKNIGFGGLLELQLTRLSSHRMLLWLVENFNCSGRMLIVDEFHKFAITPDDVYDVLMLPRNQGTPVKKYLPNEGSPLSERLSLIYGIKARAPVSKLSLKLDTLTNGGDDFKRLFVFYCLSTFLAPTANRLIRMGVVKSLEVVEDISKFDWCSYVLDKLCESIRSFQMKASKNIGGCIILLQIIYFHRLKWQGVAEPCTLPLILHWTNTKVSKRCHEEIEAGRYGCGELILDKYPLSENGVLKNCGFNVQPEVVEQGCANKVDQELKNILVELQKDANDFTTKYLGKLTKISQLLEVSREENPANSTPDISDSQFFRDERLHKYVDDLQNVFKLTKKLVDDMPHWDLLTPEREVDEMEGEYFNMEADMDGVEICGIAGEGVQTNEADVVDDLLDEELSNAMNSVATRVRILYLILPVSFGKNLVFDSSCEFWSIEKDNGYVSKFMKYNKKYFSKMCQTHKEIHDFCFYDSEGSYSLKRFYRNGVYLYVEKDDILSMRPNQKINQPIVIAWCLEINKYQIAIEKDNQDDPIAIDKRIRFVFNLEHSDILRQIMDKKAAFEDCKTFFSTAWDQWLSTTNDTLFLAEMIFIPFYLDEHYAAVVINFADSKVQYLDNRKYSNERFFNAANILCNAVVDYLQSKNHPRAPDVLNYIFENVMFKWQASPSSFSFDNDCGVYMMHHLNDFNGVPYTTPDLKKPQIRHVLRAEICANIILSNLKDVRGPIIDKALKFYNDKPALKNHLNEVRKENAAKFVAKKKKEAAETLKKLNEAKLGKRKIGG